MKQIEFDHFSPKDQQAIVWQHGLLIGLRKDAKYGYVLYSLGNFLVELQYEGFLLIKVHSRTWQQQSEKSAASKSALSETCTLARPQLQFLIQLN